MQIRQLQLTDAPLYRAFRLRGLREHPDAFTSSFEEENARPLADTEKRLAAAASEKLWGAFDKVDNFDNGKLAGMVGLYVASEFSGRGLGRALVDAVLTEALACGVELLVLTVTDSNRAACALYTRAGFSAFGTEPDAIRVDGVSFGKQHMFLQLPPA